jgi:hypothetical protein
MCSSGEVSRESERKASTLSERGWEERKERRERG